MVGLTSDQVLKRQQMNPPQQETITNSFSMIVRKHLFTLFNALNFIIAGLLFYVHAYTNMLFIGIIILNIVIGIYQEYKAKKLVDQLSVLNRTKVRVLRDGIPTTIEKEEIVQGDVLILESGDQITNDAKVISGHLEMNESLLTGESDAIDKDLNDELYSGSFVVSGKAYAEVIHVGNENYASKIVHEVKQGSQLHSELLSSMKKVIKFTTYFIIPLGIVLVGEALFLRHVAFSEAIISSSAALLGMLPKGLILLMTVSLANGVIRLSKQKILVQNTYALETLAHVDTLCLDKTGTITTGNLNVKKVIPLSHFDQKKAKALIQSYMAQSEDNNATFQALKKHFKEHAYFQSSYIIPFNSARKWSSISFEKGGTIFIGAIDQLMNTVPTQMKQELNNGNRCLVIGYTSEEWTNKNNLPNHLSFLYGLVLEDEIRPNVQKTLNYFQTQGIDLKLISGDHPLTISSIAQKAGFEHWDRTIDLSKQKEPINYKNIVNEYSIFARVSPKQKQLLVKALKKQGHNVAMTGDGVNDLLALKEADCSITIKEGSDAARQLSQIVLLDSDFKNLVEILKEGRIAVNNVSRSSGVFFIKTIYSLLVSLFCALMNVSFPFIPIQITLVDFFIEAFPSFITIFERDTKKIHPNFLKTTIQRALPFALSVSGLIILLNLLAVNQTFMYLGLIMISILAVVKSCAPFNSFRILICIAMILGIFGTFLLVPALFHITVPARIVSLFGCSILLISLGFGSIINKQVRYS